MNGIKTNKACRFLSSALSLRECLPNIFVILQEEKGRIHEANAIKEPERKKAKRNPVFVSSTETEQDNDVLLSSSSRDQKRKAAKYAKKQKHLTKVWCCTQLPKQEPSIDTILSESNEDSKKEIFIKPLLVLDINGILCHRIRESRLPHAIAQILKDSQKFNAHQTHRRTTSMYRPAIGHVANTHIVSRTDLIPFLNILNDHFTLALWSSAKRKTIKNMVDMLFPYNIKENLLFIWGQEHCDCIHESEISSSYHDSIYRKQHFEGKIYTKNVGKVFAKYPLFNVTNTLLIDDNPTKCPKYIANCIHPSPIMGLDLNVILQQIGKEEFDKSGMEIYCDETNERNQRIFFEKLIDFWKYPIQCNDPFSGHCYMASDVLLEHADQMGWRGKRKSMNTND